MIAIIDYGMGNLKSVSNALTMLNIKNKVTSHEQEIADAEGVILPGVGAFPVCMENLMRLKLIEVVKHVAQTKPFLGICLGLQLLFEESEEYGPVKGLGIFPGRVRRFRDGMMVDNERLKIPHMGWSEIRKIKDTEFLKQIPDESYFYFVHSYYVDTDESLAATRTFYGIDFISSISHKNLFACQFHPEKSQKLGLRLLENFSRIVENRGAL